MDDKEILARIEALDREETELRQHAAGRGLNDEENQRLQSIEVYLDQLWDLLRQRRARREFGQNPDDAEIRDPNIVERYEQ